MDGSRSIQYDELEVRFMWPYRPGKLTELLGRDELSALLARGMTELLGSNLLLAEADGEEAEVLCAIDEPTASPFCSLLRHGEENGETAFAGADAACRSCEKRFAERALRELKKEADAEPETGLESHFRTRCHMGLQELAAPIIVESRVLAVLIAGRRLAAKDDRSRIQKRVGKLGKLTQAEKRSMEKAGNEAVAPIIPSSEESRARLNDEVSRIPLLGSDLEEELTRAAAMLSKMAQERVLAARQAWELGVLDSLALENTAIPFRRGPILNWLDSATARIRRTLGIEFLTVFGRLPESIGKTETSLQLLSQDGLPREGEEEVSLRSENAVMRLDLAQLAAGVDGAVEDSSQGLEAPSSLIGALQATPSSPAGWKDLLTKSCFIASPATGKGLELVFVFGPPGVDGKFAPAEEDCVLLLKAARSLCDRYLLASLESKRRELSRYEEKLKKVKPSGPLRLQRFDVRKLLDTCLGPMRELGSGRDITFGTDGLPERLMMEADRDKLKDVFDCILSRTLDLARPNPENDSPSIVVSIRRDKKIRGRLIFSFDVIGRFLNGRDRRGLFILPATKEAEENETGKKSSGPISFKDAQQNISWHKGRLKVESERLGDGIGSKGDRDRGKGKSWPGRTVFAIEIPARPPRFKPGRKTGKGADKRAAKKPGSPPAGANS